MLQQSRDGVFPKKTFSQDASEFWCQCIKTFEQLQTIAVSLRNQGWTMQAHAHLHTAGNDVLKQTGVPNLAPKIVDIQPEGPQEVHAYFAKYTTVE